MIKNTQIFGLTGNMGCGKSTVAKLLKENSDVWVFDCDKEAKEILDDKRNLEKIRLILGDEIMTNNRIDKQKISRVIFSNDEKKQELEKFIHPKVWGKISNLVKNEKKKKIFIVESAIIYEIDWDKRLSGVVLVTCDKKEQISRIKIRDGLTDKQIEERLRNQWSIENKEDKSLAVIDTNCSWDDLKKKTEILYQYLKKSGEAKLFL